MFESIPASKLHDFCIVCRFCDPQMVVGNPSKITSDAGLALQPLTINKSSSIVTEHFVECH
jgi:hypothetical protein